LKQTEKYEVNLSEALQGNGEWHFDCRNGFFERLENPDVTDGDVSVDVKVKPRGDGFACDITCEGWIETQCDRCLDAMVVDVDESYSTAIIYGDPETATEEAVVIEEGSTKADLTAVIADTIILSLPLRKVHPEGECNPEMEEALHRMEAGGGSLGSLLDDKTLSLLENNE
jgi:uncharacterized metal-binding protein YceD (DUF177 family)